MHTKPLTQIQEGWLDHVNKAAEQKLSMSAYAKQNNLPLKAFYNARSFLMKKGILPSISNPPLATLTVTPERRPELTTSCRITLCNGIIIDLNDVNLTTLLSSASQL